MGLELIARFQNYNAKPSSDADTYDQDVFSPKSANFREDGTRVYVNSLEGFVTMVYDPVKIEKQLNECIPREDWKDYGHLIIDHGRKTCKARAPKCDACALYKWCEVRA